MEAAGNLLNAFLQALLQMVTNPFLYLGIAIIGYMMQRQIKMERRLFHARLHYAVPELLRSLLWGIGGGLIASACMMLFGSGLSGTTLWMLWICAAVLFFFQSRYLCFAYSVGIIGIIRFIAAAFPDALHYGWYRDLSQINVPALLVLVGILHIVEAGYVYVQGTRLSSPLFVESKRGRVIGGYQLQGYWPLPLILLVPMQSGTGIPWTPWFSHLGDGISWGFIAFPAVIGFSVWTQSYMPKMKAQQSAKLLLGYGLIVTMSAICAYYFGWLSLPASTAAVLLHEGIVWYGRWDERKRSALFVHPERGLKVLAVIPGSPAEHMGIGLGEVVRKINGIPVQSIQRMHEALQLNGAYCQLEVENAAGEVKFARRAIYAGEHHQLGLIMAPDQRAPYVVEARSTSLLRMLAAKWKRKPKPKKRPERLKRSERPFHS